MRLWTLVSSKPAIGLLAILALLVLSSVAEAGIFRKRRSCSSGSCSTPAPAASSCATGNCGSSVRYVQPAGGYTYAPVRGAAVQSCPGGVCPIQR